MVALSAFKTLQFDSEFCTGCGMCVSVCPHGVFARNGRVVRAVNPDACVECGACQTNCPFGAIKVDSGAGCAYAMIRAALTNRQQVQCRS